VQIEGDHPPAQISCGRRGNGLRARGARPLRKLKVSD